MNHLIKGAIFTLALAGAPCIATAPVAAAVDFSISLGNVAYGYNDGYWDRDHNWHAWQNRDEMQYFQTHNSAHYVDARHDQDPKNKDKGWRNDRYWDHH